MLARTATEDVELHGGRIPAGRSGAAARRLGQPRRARSSPTPTATTSTATPPSSPASASAATSASAPRWPGSRRASALEELVRPRAPTTTSTPSGARSGPLGQRPRLRHPADHGDDALMPQVRTPSGAPTARSSPARRRASARPPRCCWPRPATRSCSARAGSSGCEETAAKISGRRRRGGGAAARRRRPGLRRRRSPRRRSSSSGRSRSS